MIERLANFLSRRGVAFETISTVFDIGSRDGLQALELADLFPNAKVVAIECNSQTLEACRRNVAQNPRVQLVETAINSYSGRCAFYPIDPARTITTWADGNPGASSLFVATADYPVEKYVQNKVEVDCLRLDDLCRQRGIEAIDIIWMDLQGAEVLALQSAGTLLDTVRYIYTEVSHRAIYEGQCLFDDVEALLTSRGFQRCTKVDRRRWQQDIIYENRRKAVVVTPAAQSQQEHSKSPSLEFRLILGCARKTTSGEDETAIRRMLSQGIDWSGFARKAIAHGLAGLAGHTLSRVAPDLVPEDILEALNVIIDQTRKKNGRLFDELARLLDALAGADIAAIPFKGPVLALQAYGDLGLRAFRDLDILLREDDLPAAIATLRGAGYQRTGELTEAQYDLIHRLQGQEIVFKQPVGTALEPHTCLTSRKLALDIDYAGLWRRAQPTRFDGHMVLTLAPEDNFLVLAVHGGKELWWNLKWACDVAIFIAAHPKLDWTTIVARAQAQGCLRMVLLATALARRFFNADLPASITHAEAADPIVQTLVQRIAGHWQEDRSSGPPSNRSLSADLWHLHDGFVRRARYMARTVLLPGPQHVALVALPRRLGFAYVPLKLAHDLVALPLWRVYRHARARAARAREALAESEVALAMKSAAVSAPPRLERHRKARAAANRELAADPKNVAAWHKLGHALAGLGRNREAITCFDKAVAIAPDHAAAWRECGTAMVAVGLREEALGHIDKALALDPKDPRAWTIRARALSELMRFTEAVQASDRALSIDPNNAAAARLSIHAKLFACDWRRREDDKHWISEGLRRGQYIITPFNHRAVSDSEAEARRLAGLWAAGVPRSANPLWRSERYRHDKLRIGYVSTDFRDHVVSETIVGCIEQHDRTRFETIAISLGPDDGTAMRRRIERAFDRFIDVRKMGDGQIAKTMHELEVDIAIDLNGYSGAKRTGIFAQRPAPVQVNYLGYPGTMAVPFIDYIIADRIVIPPENRIHYSENVVDLPHSYFPTDDKRVISRTPSRSEAGLPQTGFVFACHNAPYKITPQMFDVWMRLLQAVEGSVLWLKTANSSAMVNLRREAKARGVAPDRLVFAPRMPETEDHLARLRLADLFLDTLPYNAHATACDALWAGLPVLTCSGNGFAARVGASVLYALGLPELVTDSLAEYETLALALAQDPERLAAIKTKLLRNRVQEPLFDTKRFTRNLERAYTMMWERAQRGEPPTSFAVEDQ